MSKPPKDQHDLWADGIRQRLESAGCVLVDDKNWPRKWKLPVGGLVTVEESEALAWVEREAAKKEARKT